MKTSSARRVVAILHKAHSYPVVPEKQAVVVWADVFGLYYSSGSRPYIEDEVASLLRDLREEVTTIERSLEGTEIAPLFAPLASLTRTLTGPAQIVMDWSKLKASYFQPQFLPCWEWAAVALPSEDDQVDDAALNGLRTQLEELETAAREDNVPPELRKFIEKQVKAIREALRRYAVRGLDPLRDAVSQATGAVWTNREELNEAMEKSPEAGGSLGSKFKRMWTAAAAMCDNADKINKGVSIGIELWDKAVPALSHLKDLLP